jgi:hypothetical protein
MMGTVDVSPKIPKLDEQDIAAIAAILVRTIRAQDQITADHETIKICNERIAANNKVRMSAYKSLEVFGFDAPDDVNLWDIVHDAMPDEYDRAIAMARGLQPASLLVRMGDERAKPEKNVVRRSVPVRVAILEYLRTVGESGAKVGQIKEHLQDAYGLTVHEKTPGMTLYRLMKDGLARRVGRTWFAAGNDETDENEASEDNAADASEAGGAATPPNESRSSVTDLIG